MADGAVADANTTTSAMIKPKPVRVRVAGCSKDCRIYSRTPRVAPGSFDDRLPDLTAHRRDRRVEPRAKAEMLRLWDAATKEIHELWPQIPAARFHETITAFGMYSGVASDLLLYVIDNEIHHRGQGYVYRRSLGVEPPAFYDRS